MKNKIIFFIFIYKKMFAVIKDAEQQGLKVK